MANIHSNDSFEGFLNSEREREETIFRTRVDFYAAVSAYFRDSHELSEEAITSRKQEVSNFIVSIY